MRSLRLFAFLPLAALHSACVLWCILCLWEKPEKCESPASRGHMRQQVWHLIWMSSIASTSRLCGSSCGQFLPLANSSNVTFYSRSVSVSPLFGFSSTPLKPFKTGLKFLLLTSLLWWLFGFCFIATWCTDQSPELVRFWAITSTQFY